jgi:hypothetical protein
MSDGVRGRSRGVLVVLCLVVSTWPGVAVSQSRPLPEPEPFFAAVRENLARSQEEQDRFAYKERRTELNMNPFGHLGTGEVRLYDVVPSADGSAWTRRLLERDGKPVADAEPERRERRQGRTRGDGRRSVDDVVQTLQFAIDRREIVGGVPMIVVTFKARPDARPRTRQGRLARAFAGSIWIDERAEEVAKVEAVAVDDISIGFGMIARLNEGAEVSLTREPVGHQIWLPTSLRFSGEGRAMLFRKLVLEHAIDWFDYREVLAR